MTRQDVEDAKLLIAREVVKHNYACAT